MATFCKSIFAVQEIGRSHLRSVACSTLLTKCPRPSRRCYSIFSGTSKRAWLSTHSNDRSSQRYASTQPAASVTIPIDGKDEVFSSILLRDLCNCSACVHQYTRQRLFSTADIPGNIRARSVDVTESTNDTVEIHWENDAPGFDHQHSTKLGIGALREIRKTGRPPTSGQGTMLKQVLWDSKSTELPDFAYNEYMHDDATLLKVIEQLRTHGLVFITNVPGMEQSVSTVAERIGPVKDTFYGYTWDVRTVPQAINAAYTSGALGFHTDLLYFQNPPHIQLLHCMESSSTGGASVFADAFKSALDLYSADRDAFNILATFPVNYHYDHPGSNIYRTTKPVFEMRPLRIGDTAYSTLSEFLEAWENNRLRAKRSIGADIPPLEVGDCLEKINWGPPFLAPFSLDPSYMEQARGSPISTSECLNDKVNKWHAAATKFSQLLHRKEGLHERLMQPGECVLFDNTRVLHARKAFDSGDVGKARWLRGTYVDKDPYLSKLMVLRHKFKSECRSLR